MKRRLSSLIWKIIYCLLIVLLGIGFIYSRKQHAAEIQKIENARIILISKQEMKLMLIDYKGKVLLSAPFACGLYPGNKQKKGDMKTPEGIFHVADIQNASDWKHDFKDGKGQIEGAYGPYFIRLKTPGHKGIGIHGTHDSLSIGSRTTEGCIRLHNKDLKKLVGLIYPPLTVIITPAAADEVINLLPANKKMNKKQ